MFKQYNEIKKYIECIQEEINKINKINIENDEQIKMAINQVQKEINKCKEFCSKYYFIVPEMPVIKRLFKQ